MIFGVRIGFGTKKTEINDWESKPMDEKYWKDLVSTALRVFQSKGNSDAVLVLKNSFLKIEHDYFDNWNGGTDYWNLVFVLNLDTFLSLGEKKNNIEEEILSVLKELHSDESNLIASVIIRSEIKRFMDWNAIYPLTKANVIKLIQKEQELLTDVATGGVSFVGNKELSINFQERHRNIVDIAQKVGFDYPVHSNTLDEWWAEVRCMSSYAERREYISKIFYPLIQMLSESDEDTVIDFRGIVSHSETIRKVIEDVNIFIREGKYESAVDRVHTGFHGYLQSLLDIHSINYDDNERLPSLYTKLHSYYEESIKPPEVSSRIKAILRSAGGMINAVNELRNHNTIAHPNGQLIQEREAKLVVRLVNAVVDYIEDVENSLR